MATRHQARTAVVGLLYAYDLGNTNIAHFSDEILEEGKIRNKQKDFSQALFQGTIENLEMIDNEIQKHLTDWDYTDIGKVEKSILRQSRLNTQYPWLLNLMTFIYNIYYSYNM